MTIKITTPNSGSDALTFGSATTATVAEVTGTEVSSGEGKLELKTTTGGTSAARLTIDPNGRVQIDGEMTDDFLVIKTTEAGAGSAPDVVLYRSSSTPADNDSLGKVVFRGRNDNSQDVEYAQVIAQSIDVSDGTEDGKMYLQTIQNGAHVNNLILDATGANFSSPVTCSAGASIFSHLVGTVSVNGGVRAINTTYTNSAAYDKIVYVCCSNTSASALMLNVIDGHTLYGDVDTVANAYYSATLIWPAGKTLKVNMNGNPTLQRWVEFA